MFAGAGSSESLLTTAVLVIYPIESGTLTVRVRPIDPPLGKVDVIRYPDIFIYFFWIAVNMCC